MFLPQHTYAQKSQLKQGNLYFEYGKFGDALKSFNNYKKSEKEPQTLIKRGICYLKTNKPDECIRDMALAHQLKSLDNTRFKYSAMAYFAKGEYLDAARFYKTYLNTLKPNTDEWQLIINEIKRCGFAKSKKYSTQLAFVENLGGNVNTEFDEFRPVQSPTKVGRYYFSSARSESTGGLRNKDGLSDVIKGTYSNDIYYVDLKEGNWSTVLPFDNLLNTPKHEIIQDFNSDGSIIYYTKGNDLHSGLLYTDTFKLDKNVEKLPTAIHDFPFLAEKNDRDLHFFNDSLIIFASNRPGGYGGYDLYYATQTNNVWSNPINFGPNINTSNNEISPYLIKNSKYLYFSSDRLETLGGYDIFKSEYSANQWSAPINLNSPINSAGDDIDIEISSDGMSAIFSSNRISAKGGYDLFIAYFKEQIIDQLEYTETPLFAEVLFEMDEIINDTIVKQPETKEGKSVLPIRELICKPLFFNSDEDVLNSTNLNQLRRIADLMVIYPKTRILLLSHYISEGRTETDLYFSIKRAEKIADQLQNFGIGLNRIQLFGCGSNFPLAAPYVNNIPSSLAEKTNKRIDYEIISDSSTQIKLTYDLPVVVEQYRDTKWDAFTAKNKGVTFRVQFAEVIQMLKSEVLTAFPDIIVEKIANESKYIYTIGNFMTYAEAQKVQEQLSAMYIFDSKINAYHKGSKINRQEAKFLSAEFTQLSYLLNE
jgi:outer membrane protein OmpA-like peptidoglycan-associated protein